MDTSGGRYEIDAEGNLLIDSIRADDSGDYFVNVKTNNGGRLKGSLTVKVECE